MSLSAETAKIYDRQIRLWGVDAQNRMLKTRVLVYGIRGLSAEVCKNIVLAGVGHVCIMDKDVVTYQDLGAQFFIEEKDVGKNRAEASLQRIQELNPYVKVTCEAGDIATKDATFFDNFDIVFLTNCSLNEQIRVNDITRQKGSLFFAADTFGLYAIMFEDLLKLDIKIKKKDSTFVQEKSIQFKSLREVQKVDIKKVRRLSELWLAMQLLYEYHRHVGRLPNVDEEDQVISFKNDVFLKGHGLSGMTVRDDVVKSLCRNANAELNPVCAIVGGVAAQEIIKAISRDSDPLDNYFVYDGVESFSGFVERISL
ncbi:ubiquitin-like 1-activating enzyme E1 [Acrasis kona]|uniref:Ubiquitin-like 1-activating enzyme E1 n=1 Tax=Acrasis kona TaxID=1008807 RepID=A0AAW2ZQS0_9EUKA